jgi:excisionase family DNA binding protein
MTASDGDPRVSGLGRFLTVADTAEVLNISVGQTYALLRSGELPAIRIGGSGHWRIERDRLEDYIAGQYEENRRRGLWHQAEFADVPELFADRAHSAGSDGHL